ncbi:hypothetical protein Q361_1562 [Flavobacterium croceum DSM 17960]|uniref:Uncharacterized protein n=1 Tax=Flavobacterium croceum DSM 17960 TaxID=1121886 RepID=A0A2S4N5L4_9FLAO|nr:hypothetical protein Q361_1562 [Flavobacterium croceum DSM 17960]
MNILLNKLYNNPSANSRFALLREKCKIGIYLSQEVLF